MRQPIQEMGAAGIDLLVALMSGQETPDTHVRLPTTLAGPRHHQRHRAEEPMYTDLAEPDLWDHTSDLVEPDGPRRFWAEHARPGARARRRRHGSSRSTGLVTTDVYDVTFPGFAGDPVRAWYRRPRGVDGPLPVVVEYVGYGGGRGHVLENLQWSAAGFAHLRMDTRGQGSGWSRGATPDPWGSGPAFPAS